MVFAPQETVAELLWLRDEQALAVSMLDADEATYRSVLERAASPRNGGLLRRRTVDDLLVLAAIAVLTGKRGAPRRKEPQPASALREMWRQVGEHRDKRDPDDPMGALKNFLP